MSISSEWKALPDGSEGKGSALPSVLGAELSFHLFLKSKTKLPFMSSSHEYLLALLTICCELKLSFNDLFPSVTSP